MAVVQISKIQIRRGQKNSNSGIPQLSSAEFAWAVDSQELFIGNGSVAEGAPYVGNTKILTEHDNILDLASSYQYAATDTSITLSTPRSLQSKLDEYVSVLDFGAVGDGTTDNVDAFETAFTQLFRNLNDNFKKVLLVPNGEYVFASDLAIPSNVILRGETQGGAILNIGSHNIRFITSEGLELASFNSTNRPRNINISNLTIQRTTGQTVFSGIRDSAFDDVKWLGEYVLSDTAVTLSTEPAAVFWENTLTGIKVDNVSFNGCVFETNSIDIKCNQTDIFDTSVKFTGCKFFVADTAIYINGVATQGNIWSIYDCEFEEISNQAFRSTNGQGTVISRSKFTNVGNGTGNAANPSDSMIYFGESTNNLVKDCISDRQQAAGLTSSSSTVYYPEVLNGDQTSFVNRNSSVIYMTDSFRPLAVFSAFNGYYIINYTLRLGTYSRYGQLSISVGSDLSGNDNTSEVALSDNFQYSPSLTTSPGGSLMTDFQFNVSLTSNRVDDDSTLGSNADTIVLSYKNPVIGGTTGSISFDVTYGV